MNDMPSKFWKLTEELEDHDDVQGVSQLQYPG